jgi:hypothetical protein
MRLLGDVTRFFLLAPARRAVMRYIPAQVFVMAAGGAMDTSTANMEHAQGAVPQGPVSQAPVSQAPASQASGPRDSVTRDSVTRDSVTRETAERAPAEHAGSKSDDSGRSGAEAGRSAREGAPHEAEDNLASGIVPIIERAGSPSAAAVSDIEVDADLAEGAAAARPANGADEAVIEVSDDEIEMADAIPSRAPPARNAAGPQRGHPVVLARTGGLHCFRLPSTPHPVRAPHRRAVTTRGLSPTRRWS